jgi:hypothetical protein
MSLWKAESEITDIFVRLIMDDISDALCWEGALFSRGLPSSIFLGG